MSLLQKKWLTGWKTGRKNCPPKRDTLSPPIMEVENYPKWKETSIGRTHFPLPWFWEEGYFKNLGFKKKIGPCFLFLVCCFNEKKATDLSFWPTKRPIHSRQQQKLLPKPQGVSGMFQELPRSDLGPVKGTPYKPPIPVSSLESFKIWEYPLVSS